ncbi:Serine/threonine-protein kinase/endoribonuclease IRE2 [Holothuria leucospilota]|uniref:Serine/threonine-protein kinase/endoribonuclease IRE2 n=1 Tax=Holothuria leucospilota TaxID=206669 RepID=A0A9Q0YCG2_HOLLE|nr:Serine/threonine-protein kinase/endoribonuclease IRE2 [Holothuria leucospilota]
MDCDHQPVRIRYCIQHSRFTKQDGWRLWDLSLSLNGNIAVTGDNEITHRTYIDVYTNVRHSDSRDKPKIIYSKEFEEYESEGKIYPGRLVSFYPGSDTTILSGLGDKLEVIDLIQDRVIKSRKIKLVKHGGINCLSVRETEIFVGFRRSNKITVYDVIDLNEIKSIILQEIQDGYWPYDMTAIADRIFVSIGDGKEGSERKSLIFEENGRILSELTKPTDTVQWYVSCVEVNMNTLGVAGVVWYESIYYKEGDHETVVFYSLLSENNCSFLIVEVESGVDRIRISDKGDRMITGNQMTWEVKVYDMAEVFAYSHFKEKLASTLQIDECTKLANFFKIPKDQTDAILSSDKPSENLLHTLEEKGILQPYNVERLRDAFVDLEIYTFCLHLAEIYQKTRGSRFVKEDISDMTASFKVMESKLGMRSDGKEMTDENSHSQRWDSMISRISSRVDTLKSVGSIEYSRKEKIGTGSSGSHIFGGKFGNKTVAVKKIVRENVQRELELYNLMKTKAMCNVLKILHVEEDEDFTYIVTELCEYDLKAVIEDNKNPIGASLSPEKRVKLCVDILKGLRDLHSINVIHRDLKPSNILIGVDGKAYVADFGISRNLIGETTHATGFYGTLCWMAREGMQSENNRVRYKKESDVQVAGCLMYYVLSNGHHPFEATFPFVNDTTKLMSNVEEGNYSLLHIEIYPAQCTTLLKRMLDKDMLKRPRIDDCLKEMEAVRYASKTMRSILPSGEQASAATVSVSNTVYLSESEVPDEFSRLIAKMSQNLTRINCVLLATYFNFSQAQIAVIKVESQTPGLDLLEIMKERNNINMYDLTNLQQALVELQLNGINETLVIPYQSKIDPRTHERHKISPKSP